MDKKKIEEMRETICKIYEDYQKEITEAGEQIQKTAEKFESKVPVKGGHFDATDPSQLITQSRPHYDVELVDCNFWCEEDTLYMSLRYKVATDVGDVDLLFPKVVLFAAKDELPEVLVDQNKNFKIRTRNHDFWLDDAPHPDYAGLKPSSVFEIMQDVPTREMTVSEIEEELGYKVKIIGGDCCGRCEK